MNKIYLWIGWHEKNMKERKCETKMGLDQESKKWIRKQGNTIG